MISTNDTIFLGVVVNPKTKEPVFVEREENTARTVEILIAARNAFLGPIRRGFEYDYIPIGKGYLNAHDPGDEYTRATELTGYPRAHCPQGVKPELQQFGYGTSLYTGILLLATAASERLVRLENLGGSGAGICSDGETRLPPATKWWTDALRRGLAQQMTGEVSGGDGEETETETIEDEDLEEYMSSRSYRHILEEIRDAIHSAGEWSPSSISIRGDVEREVPADDGTVTVTADYYEYETAIEKNLVAVLDPTRCDTPEWAKRVDMKTIDEAADSSYANVICALNVAHQDPLMVGKLALIAQAAGRHDPSIEAKVTQMMMRNRYGWDEISFAPRPPTVSRTFERNPPRRVRTPPICECGERAPHYHGNPSRPRGSFTRNPETPDARTAEMLMAASESLARQRQALGWDQLEDLP